MPSLLAEVLFLIVHLAQTEYFLETTWQIDILEISTGPHRLVD